jgi:phospholipid transport system substrate-binding protein
VEYRLEKSASGDWRVYDTIIEGVSMIKNYRDQFDEIIGQTSYAGLIKVIKSKLGDKQ